MNELKSVEFIVNEMGESKTASFTTLLLIWAMYGGLKRFQVLRKFPSLSMTLAVPDSDLGSVDIFSI